MIIDQTKLSQEVKDKYSILNNTFINVAKPDPKDKIEVEIGDSKDIAKFQPQMKIQRWQNECNVSIRLIEDDKEKPTIKTEKGKIKYIKKDRECLFYQKEDDSSEFEIVIKKKPKDNKLRFSIQHKGVRFCYQPSLIKEFKNGYSKEFKKEIVVSETQVKDLNGNVLVNRPEKIVGSYAIRMLIPKINIKGEKLYRNGKFRHLYRPKATDAKGNWVWETLTIDEKTGILTIEIPQEFLDKAVYPIISKGVNFGDETGGGTASLLANNTLRGSIQTAVGWSPAGDGTLDSISWYKIANTNIPKWRGVIYKADNTLVDVSDETTCTAAVGYYVATLNAVAIQSASDYILGIWIDDSDAYAWAGAYDTDVNVDLRGDTVAYHATDNPESPIDWDRGDLTDRSYGVYATYTAGAGTAYYQTCSEVVSIVDSLAKKGTKVLKDIIAIADTIAIQKTFSRTLSEIITIADTIKRSATRILTEAISIVDSVIRKPAKILSEAINVIDSISISKVLSRTLTEAISVIDTIKRGTTKVLNEAVAVMDTIEKTSSRILTEAVSIIDSISIGKILSRTLSEIISIADTIKKAPAKILSETITIADTAIRKTTKILTEAVAIADSIVKQIVVSKILTEIITIADTIKRQATKILTETISVIDSIAKQLVSTKTLTEVIAIIDSISVKKILTKTLSEIITVADTISAVISKILSETISIVDTIIKSSAKILSEAITVADSIKKTTTRIFSEIITIVDTIMSVQSKVLTEVIAIADSITKKTAKIFAEAVSIIDSIIKQSIQAKTLSEIITITDSIKKTSGKILTETITIVATFIGNSYKAAKAIIKYTDQIRANIMSISNKQTTIKLTDQVKATIKKIINN